MKSTLKVSIFLLISLTSSESYSSSHKLRVYIQEAFQSHGVKSLAHRENSFKKNNHLFELGRNLFFDKVLSGNKDISCATCHSPNLGTSDSLPVSIGSGGIGLGENRRVHNASLIPRNSPAIFNRALKGHTTVMWDGRIKREINGDIVSPEPMLNGPKPILYNITQALESTLALQALFPVTSHDEMRGKVGTNEIANAKSNQEVWSKLTKRVIKIKEYRELLFKAYPNLRSDQINFGHLANAIGVYEGVAFRATNTAFDRFMDGELYELSESQVRGAKLFAGAGKCIQCHNGPFLSDFKSHSLGVPHLGPGKEEKSNDRGLELITGDSMDRYKFKTPPLRNVALTAPYMHNGFFKSLKDAVKFHCHPNRFFYFFVAGNTQSHSNIFYPSIDRDSLRNTERLFSMSPKLVAMPNLRESDVDDLVYFLNSLTDFRSIGTPIGGIPSLVPSKLPVQD